MTTQTTQRAGLDNRVTSEDGQPVAERRTIRGWFRVTRADGPSGVLLTARIPGYMDETRPYPDQDTALRAARLTYSDYREAVRAISDQSEQGD